MPNKNRLPDLFNLLSSEDRIFSREELLKAIDIPTYRTLESHIGLLRQSLDGEYIIKSTYGKGFRLVKVGEVTLGNNRLSELFHVLLSERRIFSHDELLRVTGIPTYNTLLTHISFLRKGIAGKYMILSVYGKGYKLVRVGE